MNTLKKIFAASSILVSLALPFAANASFGPIATTGDISSIQTQINTIQQEVNDLQNKIEGLQSFGDTINQSPALFETALAAALSNNANSMTLLSGTLRDGTTLNGNYCFTIDSGLSTTEYVCGVASGTAVTALVRGIGSDGITSYGSLEFPHRYGADVKITDFPQLEQQTRLLNGTGSFPNVLQYSSSSVSTSSFTQPWQIIDKAYADALAIAGAPNASVSVNGISQIATAQQLSDGTSLGSTGAALVSPSSLFGQSSVPEVGRINTFAATSSGQLPTNTTYYFALTETNAQGTSFANTGFIAGQNTQGSGACGTSCRILLGWSGVTNASYYSIYLSTSTTFTSPSFLATTTMTSYTVTTSTVSAGIPTFATTTNLSLVPVANASGTIDPSYLAGGNYSLNSISSASTTLTGTTTISGLNITSTSFSKFGGTGTDGALTLSGNQTSSINVGSANVFIKNYSSISITGSSSLAFVGSSTLGTEVILKSTGNCVLTSNGASSTIDVSQIGGTSNNNGSGLSGGPSTGYSIGGSFTIPGPSTEGFTTAVAGRGMHVAPSSTSLYGVFAGAGGGNGDWTNGAVNGQGGGGLVIECLGSLNFTGTINANGNNGFNGSGSGSNYGSVCGNSGGGSNTDGNGPGCTSNGSGNSGGGGGGAGSVWIGFDGNAVSTIGTITVNGGAGGTGTQAGATGGNGFSWVGKNTEY